MKLTYYPYIIKLKEEFSISGNSRMTTPVVMVEIEHNGLTGYGEASLPPYLTENQSSVFNFLDRVNLDFYDDLSEINLILDEVENIAEGNNAAKAAIDIALHDLLGKVNDQPLYQLLEIRKKERLYTSYTIGISNTEDLDRKVNSAFEFKFLKIKLGTQNDQEIVSSIRKYTNKPLFVDINQGWSDKYFALDMINWLNEQNVILIEQPLPKENFEDSIWLCERSPLPIVADEAIQGISDLEKIKDIYSGVNIKLMKAGGIRNAHSIIMRARELKLKIMIGCMTETSCAVTAASHLAQLADWIDLDGSALISNDLFDGMKIKNGEIIVPDRAGIGIDKIPG
jgi:L-alanine-DL-glutamate epimerase-like enolase superfamily enzyme